MNFPIKCENVNFSTTEARLFTKKITNSNEQIAIKLRKTSIFGHFGPKRPIFDTFLQRWTKQDFFAKALGKFLPPLQATKCKVSEKSNEGIPRKRVANGQTMDKRTDEG